MQNGLLLVTTEMRLAETAQDGELILLLLILPLIPSLDLSLSLLIPGLLHVFS